MTAAVAAAAAVVAVDTFYATIGLPLSIAAPQ